MWCLKCCPKCNTGALYEGGDVYGSYIACLHCGHYLSEEEEVALAAHDTRHASDRTGLQAEEVGVA